MHNSPETKAIRQRMEEVRGDLDTGFQGIVEDARDIGDWTYYVKTYPWAVLGVAVVAGYLIAPRLGSAVRPRKTTPAAASGANGTPAPPPPPKADLSGKVLSIVGNLLLRGATACVVQQADRFFTTRAARSNQNEHL